MSAKSTYVCLLPRLEGTDHRRGLRSKIEKNFRMLITDKTEKFSTHLKPQEERRVAPSS